MADEIRLYASIASRSFTAYWMLEELGVEYQVIDTDLRAGRHKSGEYLRVNPAGKVPAIEVEGTVITERAAICTYLADRFAYGVLAPRIEDAARGPYLKWMIYTSTALEPALAMKMARVTLDEAPWNPLDALVIEIGEWFERREYVLGAAFSAADVMLGSVVGMAMYNRMLPDNAHVNSYHDRVMARPACVRAMALTWPGS